MNTLANTTLRNAAMRAGAAIGLCVLLAGSTGSAQNATDLQALKKEIEALKQRQDALQKEVDALKALARLPIVSAPPLGNIAPPGNIVLRLDRAPIRGAAAARVTLVEVSDFECPFCGRHFRQTSQLIERNYVQSGKIRLAFLHFPLGSHRNAFKAAEAGACAADQGKFWEMHDRLFSNQAQLFAPMLPAHGTAVGVNPDQFRACLDTNRHAQDVRDDMAMAQRAGVTATPTFFIGMLDPKTQTLTGIERIVGAKPYAVLQQALDAALARK